MARLYPYVVRPGLVAAGAAAPSDAVCADESVTLRSARGTLALLAATPAAIEAQHGQGRSALVVVGRRPLEAIDGQVICDLLAADGWEVAEVVAGTPGPEVAAIAAARQVELVVMPTARAADLLASAAAYTALRRLNDPPLIVACGLGESEERRARAAGADAFATDLEEMLALVWRWLPARGERHWGVRLRKLSDTLVIAPTGHLDEPGVGRLRAVVDSRAGRYGGLVVDARDIARVTVEGLDALVNWLSEPVGDGSRGPRIVAGHRLVDALALWDRPAAMAMLLDPGEIAEAL